jgi:hypothetical protein
MQRTAGLTIAFSTVNPFAESFEDCVAPENPAVDPKILDIATPSV